MNRLRIETAPTHAEIDWTPFPGGELEGERSKALCAECRAKAGAGEDGAARVPDSGKPALCFQCYRAGFERTRRIEAAGELNTASDARFQAQLPFEPVNAARLARLKVEREASRVEARIGAGVYAERRRRAQIMARQALARIAKGLNERRRTEERRRVSDLASGRVSDVASGFSRTSNVVSVAPSVPESWLPFVVSR